MSNPNQVVVSQVSDVTTVEITTQGPQGPAAAGVTFDVTGKVDDAIFYYHAASDTFDKINKRELELGAAAMTALVYLIDNYKL